MRNFILIIIVLFLITGCSSPQKNYYSPPEIRPRVENSDLPWPSTTSPAPSTTSESFSNSKSSSSSSTSSESSYPKYSSQTITNGTYQCSQGILLRCEAQPVGNIRNVIPAPPTMICGRCVDNKAEGLVRSVWCKNGACRNGMDINDARQVYGKFTGQMSKGQFAGGSVMLITALGTFYGTLRPDGGYESGMLKKPWSSSTFIGQFNADGSPAHGVMIDKKPDGKFIFKLGDFVDSKLDGYAYFYEDTIYTIMSCTKGDCRIYNRDVPKDKTSAVLDVISSEFTQNLLLEKPIKMALLAALPPSRAVRIIMGAYEAWGNYQFGQDIGAALK
jgi:hypothetical protein